MAAPGRIARNAAEKGGNMSTTIEIKNIVRRFGQHTVLNDVNLSVQPGELLALLGPSGSGKTTLLRLIAGLDFPDTGIIKFDKDDALGRKPKERGVGFVFQHYALFRHMTVFENIAFALRVRRAPKSEVTERVNTLLKLIQLETLAGRYPAQLSGGQRQRVALARALAIQPRVLLLDEPFGALDAVVRRDLRRWLRNLHEEMNITTLFVTHDQEEAFELADRVVIMNAGRIFQEGTPIDIYRAPADAFVHEFLGESNKFPSVIQSGIVHAAGAAGIPLGTAPAPNGEAIAYIRPHHVLVRPNPRGAWRVSRLTATGAQARIAVTFNGITADSVMAADALLESGLTEGAATDVTFTGGTLFDAAGKNPIKIAALKPTLAQLGTGTR
jgi:sulfate/thiosulfate transport system ATP-binding protein